MIIRPFRPGDKQHLRQFRCATRHDPDYERLIAKMFRDELLTVLNDPQRGMRAFVAESRSGQLAGIVAVEQVNAHDWEVAAVGVSIDHRRKGLATALIKYAVHSTPAADARNVLFLVDTRNKAMHELVSTFGATRSPDPGSTIYDVHSCLPSSLVHDVHQVMDRVQKLEIAIGDDDDDWRLGIGLGPIR